VTADRPAGSGAAASDPLLPRSNDAGRRVDGDDGTTAGQGLADFRFSLLLILPSCRVVAAATAVEQPP
jgi:hypothetical protein